jgi:hypothetical protein
VTSRGFEGGFGGPWVIEGFFPLDFKRPNLAGLGWLDIFVLKSGSTS